MAPPCMHGQVRLAPTAVSALRLACGSTSYRVAARSHEGRRGRPQRIGIMVTDDARAAAILVILAGTLASCSTLERANPMTWFGDDTDKAAQPAQLPTDEPYPNLADVP